MPSGLAVNSVVIAVRRAVMAVLTSVKNVPKAVVRVFDRRREGVIAVTESKGEEEATTLETRVGWVAVMV